MRTKVVTVSDLVRRGKAKLGNAHMSDREFGERLGPGYAPTTVSNARYGKMSDVMALDLAALLGDDPGAVLMVARAEREPDARVKAALLAYVGKVIAPVLGALLVVASGLQPQLEPAGGEGRH